MFIFLIVKSLYIIFESSLIKLIMDKWKKKIMNILILLASSAFIKYARMLKINRLIHVSQ